MFGEHLGDGGGAHLVPGSANPLQTAGNGRRGFDQNHEVDRRHVDAELEGGGGDDGPKLSAFEHVLDLESLLARDRPMVGAHQILSGQPVQLAGQPFGEAAAVHEEDRRAVLFRQLQESGVHRGPDGTTDRILAWCRFWCRGLLGTGHVFDGNHDLDVESPLLGRVHDGDGARPPIVGFRRPATQEL